MKHLLPLCILLVTATSLLADFPPHIKTESHTPLSPVTVTYYEFEQPRPLRVWAVRIDATHPDLEFTLTPKTTVTSPKEVLSETTLAFAKKEKLDLAINASPFDPVTFKNHDPITITGLHLSRGRLVSPADQPNYGALLLDGRNFPEILQQPITPDKLKATRLGLGGFTIVLRNKQNLSATDLPPTGQLHPRTAVGLSDAGKILWWLIIDGRQPKVSEGVALGEMGELALKLGMSDLLNLDGGGSTTLVQKEGSDDKYKILNKPVGLKLPGSLRFNGNNLGLRLWTKENGITSAHLKAIMPNLKAEKVPLFLGPLNRTMEKYSINTPLRRAAFLAQLAHESGELRYMEELSDGKAYEGRKDLGNTEPGDGPRYKGRGPIQITGRHNYTKAGAALELDLVKEPELASDPEIGCQLAGWFWDSHKLNELADSADFLKITKVINGGTRGQKEREKYYERAKEVLR